MNILITAFQKALLFPLLLALFFLCEADAFGQKHADKYLAALNATGTEPLRFVNQVLDKYDLILFDDAIHSAYEPFVFYSDILKDPNISRKIDFVFIEVFSIGSQPLLDKFFTDTIKSRATLQKVFQDDFSGFGWRYETYINLLESIWDINHSKEIGKRIKVIGVDQPVYWEGIHSKEQYNIFSESLMARDYFMYKVISGYMENFKAGRKGIFLTNTRHAYVNLRDKEGKSIWNCATFFHNWHPRKAYSIRFHNYTLSIGSKRETEGKTIQGLEEFEYKWIKMDDGNWDRAFELYENKPVAIDLKSNPFGKAKYIGNLMLSTRSDQTMEDAYDAIIFLKPLNQLHFSATTDFFFTPDFKKELKRRIIILYEGRIQDLLNEYQVKTIEECIDLIAKPEPVRSNILQGN